MGRGSIGASLRGMGRGSGGVRLWGIGRGSAGARLRGMGRGDDAKTALSHKRNQVKIIGKKSKYVFDLFRHPREIGFPLFLLGS